MSVTLHWRLELRAHKKLWHNTQPYNSMIADCLRTLRQTHEASSKRVRVAANRMLEAEICAEIWCGWVVRLDRWGDTPTQNEQLKTNWDRSWSVDRYYILTNNSQPHTYRTRQYNIPLNTHYIIASRQGTNNARQWGREWRVRRPTQPIAIKSDQGRSITKSRKNSLELHRFMKRNLLSYSRLKACNYAEKIENRISRLKVDVVLFTNNK